MLFSPSAALLRAGIPRYRDTPAWQMAESSARTPRRLEWAWCIQDWAMSVFTNSVVLIPVLVTDLAKSAASPWGSKYASPGCISCKDFDPTGEQPFTPALLNTTADSCNTLTDGRCLFNFTGDEPTCAEVAACVPTTANQCCVSDPAELTVSFFGTETNYASVFAYCVAISVVLQIVSLIALGPLADYAHYHRKMLRVATVVGGLSVVAITLTAEGPWEIAAALFVVSNVAFGLADVAYNAYLPKLFAPARFDSVGAKGFMYGQAGGITCLLLMFVPIMVLEDHCLWGLSVGIGLSGLWWLFFSVPFLQAAPSMGGKPIPEGMTAAGVGFRETKAMFVNALKYPQLVKFLVAYFIFSDGISTLVETVSVYASVVLCFTFIDLVLVILVVELSALLGAWMFTTFVEAGRLRIRTAMHVNLFMIMWLPLLTLPGVNAFSSDYQWTFFLAAFVFGINAGSIGALGRSYFSRLVPKGNEVQLFSVYEITNKGTAWLGPLTVAIINDATGSFEYAFFSQVHSYALSAPPRRCLSYV